ncbi:MAG: hypothetical protein F6K54_03205 [Okeania sp. SIO3B5]|uniref:hypothetical protein n=1 Tax=Okeania sp. SIO3B5 TaxID=2607811 RepID=UPI001400B125|nr:hypothetical protein [Okeania sp. SIO3B5]NEO52175.1 hypothetical protein [Okeania sp. SIO3B5]
MTTKVDYTNSEWQLLLQAITLVSMIIIASEFTLFSAVKEVFTFKKEVKHAKLNYQDNQLIQNLLVDIAEKTTRINEIENAVNFPEFLEDAQEKIKAAVAIADLKATPKEAQEYKEFLYEIATQIANASGEGIFGTGPKISQQEAIVLERLKMLLELDE